MGDKEIEYAKRRVIFLYRMLFKPKVVRNYGVRIAISEHISSKILRFIYDGSYEGQEISILSRNLHESDIVLDIGAGIGFLTCWCARKIGNDNVYAIEANPQLISRIKENLDLNDLHPKIWNKLISNSPKTKFYVEKDFWSSSIFKRSSQTNCIEPQTISLDDILNKTKANFLIIDIEGGEENLLSELDYSCLQKILIEVHPHVIGKKAVSNVVLTILENGMILDTEFSRDNVLFFYR